MTFEIYAIVRGTGNFPELKRIWPSDPEELGRPAAREQIDKVFAELVTEPDNSDFSLVVYSPTINKIVAIEYPTPTAPPRRLVWAI